MDLASLLGRKTPEVSRCKESHQSIPKKEELSPGEQHFDQNFL